MAVASTRSKQSRQAHKISSSCQLVYNWESPATLKARMFSKTPTIIFIDPFFNWNVSIDLTLSWSSIKIR